MKDELILRTAISKPWMILPDKLAEIFDFLRIHSEFGTIPDERIQAIVEAANRRKEESPADVGSVKTIPILGTIVPRSTSMSAMSGLPSVQGISKQLREGLADDSVSSIVFDIDSPGGMVDGIPDLAADIRSARRKKPIYASVNGLGASAAYYLASATGRIAATQTSEVGSIGVITGHREYTAMEEKKGIKTTIVKAGKYKAEANPWEPLSKEAKAELQESVNYYYDLFLRDVAKGRGVKKATVETDFGEGRLVRPNEALRKGMIDAIETPHETIIQAAISGTTRGKAAKVTTIRDFERFLRDVGFSSMEAKKIASKGFREEDRETSREAAFGGTLVDIARKHLEQ